MARFMSASFQVVGFDSCPRCVTDFAAVGFNKFLALHEESARAVAAVIDAALVGGDHEDEELVHTLRGVELAAPLAFRAGETAEEVLIDAAKDVLGAVGAVAEADGADEVNEFAEAVLVERRAGIVFRENAFEARVVALDGDHGVVHDLADGGLLGAGLKVEPAGIGGHPEDVLGLVFVGVFGVRADVVAFAGEEFGAVFLEGIGDVFEEDEAEDDVLVLRRVHVIAELVGGEPELGLEAEIGGGVFRRSGRGLLKISCHLNSRGIVGDVAAAGKGILGRGHHA
jgi:hypothetical protein